MYNPDGIHGIPNFGPLLYYSSLLGLAHVTELILKMGANVNAQGGYFGNAASHNGDRGVVELLLERGADVNAQRPAGSVTQRRSRGHGAAAGEGRGRQRPRRIFRQRLAGGVLRGQSSSGGAAAGEGRGR